MSYLWKNVLIESSSIFVGNITASHGMIDGYFTAQNFIGTASCSTTSSHAIFSENASHFLGSSLSSSYTEYAVSSSYVSGTLVVPGNDREILMNSSGYIGSAENFTYTSESILTFNTTGSEPTAISGSMYMDSTFSRLRVCVSSLLLYYGAT